MVVGHILCPPLVCALPKLLFCNGNTLNSAPPPVLSLFTIESQQNDHYDGQSHHGEAPGKASSTKTRKGFPHKEAAGANGKGLKNLTIRIAICPNRNPINLP